MYCCTKESNCEAVLLIKLIWSFTRPSSNRWARRSACANSHAAKIAPIVPTAHTQLPRPECRLNHTTTVNLPKTCPGGFCVTAQLNPAAACGVKGQKIFTVSVASKPIPHPTQNFLLAASDPTSLASAKNRPDCNDRSRDTRRRRVRAIAAVCDNEMLRRNKFTTLGTARISRMRLCGIMLVFRRACVS